MKIYLYLMLLVFLTLGCKKENNTPAGPFLPKVTTTAISAITPLSVSTGGAVTDDGGATVTSRGICWNTSPAPLASGNHTTDGTGTGTFNSSITGLTPGTQYYARAYATNSVGTMYGSEISFTTTIPDIYTAGYENNALGYSVAKVWKNGVGTALTSGFSATQGWATCVYVSGANVYVTGYEFNGVNYSAKLWTNGVATSLSNGNYDAQAAAVSVIGSDVYAGGYEKNAAGISVAKIWKNNIATSLTDGTDNAQVKGIFISAADIYAVGFEVIAGKQTAKLWKNGVGTALPGGATSTSANSVFVSGNNVYIAGGEIITGGYSKVVLWTNEVPAYLTTGFSSIAIAYGVFVNGTDVYVAGFDQSTGTGLSNATLWKNGIASALTNGLTYARANGVYVYNNEVYVTGYDLVWPNTISKTWKNGTIIQSTNGAYNASTTSVFVR